MGNDIKENALSAPALTITSFHARLPAPCPNTVIPVETLAITIIGYKNLLLLIPVSDANPRISGSMIVVQAVAFVRHANIAATTEEINNKICGLLLKRTTII